MEIIGNFFLFFVLNVRYSSWIHSFKNTTITQHNTIQHKIESSFKQTLWT